MKKVMLVDDELLALNYLKNMIDWEEHGYEVVECATSGKKALAAYDKQKPDIVISDIKMVGMDGLELTKKLKQINPGILIVLLSAYKDFDYAKKGIEYGVENY